MRRRTKRTAMTALLFRRRSWMHLKRTLMKSTPSLGFSRRTKRSVLDAKLQRTAAFSSLHCSGDFSSHQVRAAFFTRAPPSQEQMGGVQISEEENEQAMRLDARMREQIGRGKGASSQTSPRARPFSAPAARPAQKEGESAESTRSIHQTDVVKGAVDVPS